MNMRKIAGSFVVVISLFALVVSVPIVARWQLEHVLFEMFGERAQVEAPSLWLHHQPTNQARRRGASRATRTRGKANTTAMPWQKHLWCA